MRDRLRARDYEHLVGISCDDDESRRPDRCPNTRVGDLTYCRPGNVIASKIRRKRISRGVQYDVPAEREKSASNLFLNCFRPRSRKYRPTREVVEGTKVSTGQGKSDFVHELRNQMIESSAGKIVSGGTRPEKSCNTTEQRERPTDYGVDSKKDKDEVRSSTNANVDGKQKEQDKPEDHAARSNRFGVSWPRKIKLRRNNNPPAQTERSIRQDDPNVFVGNKGETVETDVESKQINSDRRCNNDFHGERNVRFSDLKAGDARKSAGREDHVNEARNRLDLCIAELNEIIRDACVIFGGGKSAARRSSS